MRKQPTRDHSVRKVVLVSLLAVAAGFAAVWLYLTHAKKLDAEVRFLTLSRVAISRDGHSMAATVAIRTSGGDAGWAARQKQALEEVVKHALMQADPIAARGPQGIARLQHSITESSKRMLETDKVQEAIVTDFLVAEGGY